LASPVPIPRSRLVHSAALDGSSTRIAGHLRKASLPRSWARRRSHPQRRWLPCR
jgi:hypothetical protein